MINYYFPNIKRHTKIKMQAPAADSIITPRYPAKDIPNRPKI